MSVIVRPATVADLPDVFRFIHALAEYEKAQHEVVLSIDALNHQWKVLLRAVLSHIQQEHE